MVLVALGYVGFTQWRAWQDRQAAGAVAARPTTAVAIQTNIAFAVNAAGEIAPAEQVSVKPEINGRIELLPVDLGDRVKQGDLLFKLDDKELQQQRASSLTAIERARLELAKAARDYERAQGLLQEKLISQELYDNTKTTYELAKNSLERAQRELALIDERLTKTEVRAPFDCTILTRPVSTGQAVSGSGGFNSGTEVLTIADLNYMIINAHVNQADVPRLRVDQEVEVMIEAVAGLSATGIVERIAPQATIRNNIKGFAARIRIENPDERIRPGMTANIKIPVAAAANVVAVPLSAVFTERNPDTGAQERYVYVQTPDGFQRRDVTVGISDFFYAEIQSGLAAGEVVALELPKEERDKQSKAMAALKPVAGTAAVTAGVRASQTNSSSAVSAGTGATNRPAAGPASPAPAGGGRGT